MSAVWKERKGGWGFRRCLVLTPGWDQLPGARPLLKGIAMEPR